MRGAQPVVALAAGLALAGAIGIQAARDARFPERTVPVDATLYVRSPDALKRLALSFDALAADVYWIRAIQHFGGQRLSQAGTHKYELLYPLLDLATTLDPYFNIAYRFGAIFLSEPPPGGPGRPDQAIALLRKGIAAQPEKWQYYQDIAFVYYWHLRDYQAAATWFRRASERPNAPNWLAPMAATMLTHGQDRASARFLWNQIRTSDQDWLRRAAERSLLQLDAMDAIDMLQAAITRAAMPPGDPYSWRILVRRGVLRGIPADPAGVPFDINPKTGEVTVSRSSPLFPMPEDNVRPTRDQRGP
jgi:tetratricopeptide (TPR) repeat protein